jgi:Cu(I)/Ag(I) efflux system membrane protein CusA/SilA
MSVGTTILGLIPLMRMTGTGASVMKRIAAPIIGGLITSTIHTQVVIPSIYALLRQPETARLKTP